MKHPDPMAWWANRRKMAWLALISGLLVPTWGWAESLAPAVGPYLAFVGAVVLAYIGAATIDDKWNPKS